MRSSHHRPAGRVAERLALRQLGAGERLVVVAGGGGGSLVHPGVHYRSASGENTSDILLSCLQTVDPEATSAGGDIGLSTTPCTAILA